MMIIYIHHLYLVNKSLERYGWFTISEEVFVSARHYSLSVDVGECNKFND